MKTRFVAAAATAIVFASTSAFVACSSDDTSTTSTTSGTTATTRITAAAGGTVSDATGSTSLVIPAGALAADTDITLTILPKSGAALTTISQFGPDGLTFLKPVTLTIKAEGPATSTLALHSSGVFTAIAGSTYANGAATGSIEHFSEYTVIDGAQASTTDGGTDSGVSNEIDGATNTPDGSTSACQPTGGLTPPAAGKAVINATFSDSAGGYNGSVEAFTGPEAYGMTNPGGARFSAYNKAPTASDETLRQIAISIPPNPTACQVIQMPTSPTADTSFMYYEGAGLKKQWVCSGPVVIDTVAGTSYTFHFDVACAKSPVLDAAGTVKISGKGAGTAYPQQQ